MARMKRKWHPKGYYHIVMRGNNRQNIFIDETDIKEYYRVMTYAHYLHSFELHAYCIMTNHVHLLLRSPNLMRTINKRYSDYYRKHHNFLGQIYQNRYYSKEIIDPAGLLIVSAYIHLNPIETKVPMVEHLEDYPYSSYFHNQQNDHPFVHLDKLPMILRNKHNHKNYAAWCLEELETETFRNKLD